MAKLLRAAAALCAITLVQGDIDKLRGVSPTDASKYSGSTFACDNGSKLPISSVNDDYCDCVDGTDEPGTSACPNGKYFCKNEKFVPQIIYSSMVNDGICDCCDGSDEYGTGLCTDTCDAAAELARAERRRMLAIQEEGYQVKLQLIEEAKRSREVGKARLAELEALIAEHAAKQTELEEEVSRARKEAAANEQAAPPAAETQPEPVPQDVAAEEFNAEEDFDFDDDAELDLAEAEKLQEQMKHLEDEVRDAEAGTAAALLRVAEARLSDFKVKMSSEVRERDELRRKLEATQDFGPDQEFFPLFGQCYDTHVDNFRYEICPFDRATQNPGEISLGERSISTSFCSSRFEWSGQGSDPFAKYTEMRFTDGTPCWQGPSRSATVRLVCSKETKLDNVHEPQKCVYTMDFHTPTVCTRVESSGHDEL